MNFKPLSHFTQNITKCGPCIAHICDLMYGAPLVRILRFRDAQNFKVQDLEGVYPSLTHLSFRGGFVKQLFPWCAVQEKLVALELKHVTLVTDGDLLTMATFCTNLRTLSLTDVVKQVSTFHHIIQSCTRIINLDLSVNRCVSDGVVLFVVQRLLSLRHFNLHKCYGLTSLAAQYIASHCPASLQELCVDVCIDRCHPLMEVLKQSPNITRLSLWAEQSVKGNMTDLTRLFVHMKHITHLKLVESLVSNEVMRLVGTHCRNLVHLDISRQKLVLDGSVLALARGCPKLCMLLISDSSCVTAATRALWFALCPRLRIVDTDHYLYEHFGDILSLPM